MFDRLRLSLAAACIALLAGCAHPILIGPDHSSLMAPTTPIVAKKAGYYISEEDRAREITTPGGGGDKVRYFPYRDLEPGLYRVLGAAFGSIARLDKLADAEGLRSQGISLIVIPTITTNSSSDSMLTWPPTSFTVELECRFTDAGGTELAQTRVVGFGNATFDEFKRDFSLAAKRASADALNKLSTELAKVDALRK